MNTHVSTGQVHNVVQPEILNNIIQAIAGPDQPLSPDYLRQLGVSQENVQQLFVVRGILHQYQVNQQVAAQMAAQQQHIHLDNSSKETFETISQIKNGLNRSIQSSRNIQNWTALMYLTTYFLGLGLVVFGVFFGNAGEKGDWFTLTFGASGFVLILATLVSNPPRELQRVRSNYVQLSMLALGWFNEFFDNSQIRRIASQMVVSPELFSVLHDLTNRQNETTRHYTSLIERFTEPNSKNANKELIDILSTQPQVPQGSTEAVNTTTAARQEA